MQISKSEKKILGPPLPNPGDAPVLCLKKHIKLLVIIPYVIYNILM